MSMSSWTSENVAAAMTLALGVSMLLINLVIVWKIATDRIDLNAVIMEKDGSGKASISRFQLLVFTLAIAGLYVILSVESGALIDVPNGALALLGISGGSFVVSKGIGNPTKRPPSTPSNSPARGETTDPSDSGNR